MIRTGLLVLCFIWLCSIEKTLLPIILLFGIIIHESGHIIAATAVKAPKKGVSSQHFGICLYYDFSKLSYKKEFLVHISGAAANIFSAALALLLFEDSAFIDFFVKSSFAYAFFNLIPFRKSDGGRALSAFLSTIFSQNVQETISGIFHFASVLFFWTIAVCAQFVYDINLSLLVLSVYLLFDFILVC